MAWRCIPNKTSLRHYKPGLSASLVSKYVQNWSMDFTSEVFFVPGHCIPANIHLFWGFMNITVGAVLLERYRRKHFQMVISQQPSTILAIRFFGRFYMDVSKSVYIVSYVHWVLLSPKGCKKETFSVTQFCIILAYKMVKAKKNENLPENNAIGMFLL